MGGGAGGSGGAQLERSRSSKGKYMLQLDETEFLKRRLVV